MLKFCEFQCSAIAFNQSHDGGTFERSDIADQWQLPQGGMDAGETPVEAAWRELEEETGLGPKEVELVDEFSEWTVYQWPNGARERGRRLGQAQRWFTFRALSDKIVPIPDGVEFVSWKWVEPAWLIDQVVEFRRSGYERVLGTK